MERQMQSGKADRLVALEPWNFPRSIVRALRRVKSQVTRIAKERRDRYRPFIAAVLRDSGLMRDQQEEGLVSSHSPRDTRRVGWS
jgi:transposase